MQRVPKLEQRIRNHKTKEPIDFSKRTLARIFSNGSFKKLEAYTELVAECCS